MKKRGQVTVFIVLGILVLVILGLLFYFREGIFGRELSKEEAQRFVSARVEPVKEVVRNCVGTKLIEGVRLVSWQGGYFDPVNYKTTCVDYDFDSDKCLEEIRVSYACKDGANTLPLVSFISNEINQFMNNESEREELENCIKGSFDDFESEGLNLDYSFSDLVLDDPVVFSGNVRQEISFPVDISKSGYSTGFEDLEESIKSNLYDLYMIAVDVVNAECGGAGFEIDDYVWEREQGGDILAASISNGPNDEGYKPWYLESFEDEEDGKPLRFHFLIEE